MNVIVACEFSGVVRDAFRRLGHEAWSSNLEGVEPEGEFPQHHLEGDCLVWLDGQRGPVKQWDLMIAHPTCTYLAVSGVRWLKNNPERQAKSEEALEFVRKLFAAPIPRKCVENPVSIISSKIRPCDQTIDPWEYGHGELKRTCLWLENLPQLIPTLRVPGRVAAVHRMPPGPNRSKDRSRTYPGFANAFASQWGRL